MKKRPRRMTAAEHEAWLKSTGQYDVMLERQRQQEEERQKRAAEMRRAEAPLVEELRAAGYAVDSVWDLVNTAAPYPDALPILLDHLRRSYPAPVREGIARALAVPEAIIGWKVLTELFRTEREKRVKDGLACAIAAAADEEVIDEVIAFVRDPQQISRVLMLSALERSSDPRAKLTLLELAADPVLGKESRAALRRLKLR